MVIAIIAILAAMLLPALAKAKIKAQGIGLSGRYGNSWPSRGTSIQETSTNSTLITFGANETFTAISSKTFDNWVNNVMALGSRTQYHQR